MEKDSDELLQADYDESHQFLDNTFWRTGHERREVKEQDYSYEHHYWVKRLRAQFMKWKRPDLARLVK
jgi:hypothetical protein